MISQHCLLGPLGLQHVIPYIAHTSKNMFKIPSYPLKKYTIHTREASEYNVTKPQYEGSDNSHTERSYGEKYIQDNSHTVRSHGEKYIQFY